MKAQSNILCVVYALIAILLSSCKDETSGQKPQMQSASPPKSKSGQVAPRVIKTTSMRSNLDAAVEGLKNGDLSIWEDVFTRSADSEQWRLLEHAYGDLGEQRVILSGAISGKSITSKLPSSFATKLYDSLPLIDTPKQLASKPEELGWSALQEVVSSPKHRIASAIMRSGDIRTLARVWKDFNKSSDADQRLIAMVADLTGDLSQIPSMIAAANGAKSEDIRISILDAAARILTQALGDPIRRDAARKLSEQMSSVGLARPLLIDALANMNR